MSIHCWFPLGLTGLITLQFKGLSKVISSTIIWKYQFFGDSKIPTERNSVAAFFMIQLSYPYMTTEKNHSFDCVDLYQQIDVSAFESRVCHSFPSKEQMSFNFMAAVILEPKKIKSVTAYPWLNYKYKIFRTAVEVYHKTPGQECSQTSRKNFTNHQNCFSCPFLFLWIFLSQCKLVCTRISLISQATIKYILNEKCT